MDQPPAAGLPPRPLAWLRGPRRLLLLCIVLFGAVAWWRLGLKTSELELTEGGRAVAGQFLSAALRPAFDYETKPVGEVAPFMVRVLRGAFDTLRYAGAAVALSVLCGLALGFLGSSAWWSGEARGGPLRRLLAPSVYFAARLVMIVSRSIHELIWALLLLAAFGLTPMAAVVAIAIPYSGTLAKVFSEMADEMPRDTMLALRAAGATPLKAWLFGVVPRALPDLLSYILYRFECGIRSATVLSFMGFSTIGLYLQQAFDNGDYPEAWTCLYTMLALVLCFDWWSAALRRRMDRPRPQRARSTPPPADADALRRARPRDRFLRASLWLLGAFAALAMSTGFFMEIRWSSKVTGMSGLLAADEVRWSFGPGEWDRRLANLHRFMADVVPAPMREESITWNEWLRSIGRRAVPAAWTTLWISVVSIVIAGIGAWLTLPFVARNAAVARPWLDAGRAPSPVVRAAWFLIRQAVKVLHVLSRAVPEVILAFLFLAVLRAPDRAPLWPAILALAIHNFGILGRLGAETLDNSGSPLPSALRASGATRLQIMGLAVFPAVLPRFLIYFFYRWETCLRETTALGILGVATLGFYIKDAESRFRYDEMLAFVLTGAAIVIACDLLSALVRARIRRVA